MTDTNMITASQLKSLRQEGKRVVIVDIRSPDEFAREHIPEAHCVPLDTLSKENLSCCNEAECVVVHCQGGIRTCQATPQLNTLLPQYKILEGGLNAWKQSGGALQTNKKSPLPIQRQVFICIGLLILLSLALAQFVSPWFNLLILFFGTGLIVAGVTGFCALAKLLSKLPYNQTKIGV